MYKKFSAFYFVYTGNYIAVRISSLTNVMDGLSIIADSRLPFVSIIELSIRVNQTSALIFDARTVNRPRSPIRESVRSVRDKATAMNSKCTDLYSLVT